MLELTDVDAFYGNSRALQGINLMVGNGEFLSVLGRNGVGKTTLMRSILGLMDRVTGRLSLDGADISPLRTYQRAKAGIAYVPQGRGILPRFTVRENLTLGTFAAKSAGSSATSRSRPSTTSRPSIVGVVATTAFFIASAASSLFLMPVPKRSGDTTTPADHTYGRISGTPPVT